jgi:phosphatidylglycerophosphatase A
VRTIVTKIIVTFFGTGLISKKMPGTVGSLAATVLCLFLHSNPSYICLPVFIVGLISCHVYLKQNNFCVENLDPGYIVIDEVFGIYLGAYILSLFGMLSPTNIIVNFVLFRIFDIFKTFPIRNIEKLCKKHRNTAALGIMLDDGIAAIIATFIQIYFFIFIKSLI